jgi:phosphoribosylaminoimidazole-succinocarboxamide synthase
MNALHESNLAKLRLLGRGKVRDLYEIDSAHLLMVASDRLSAFDVVLPQPIPGKGEVLTRVSRFWFARTARLVPNHLADIPVSAVVEDPEELAQLGDRAMVVRRLTPLPVEAIVRGYLIGSGWKDYRQSGAVCGIALPPGLRQADRLPSPSTRRRPRPRSAVTTRTWTSPTPSSSSAERWRNRCVTSASPSIANVRSTPWRAGSSSPTPSSNSASTARGGCI